MAGLKRFVAKQPVAIYVVLTFAISWGGVLLIIGGQDGLRGAAAQFDPRFAIVYLAMLAGPTTAGLLMTLAVDGTAGLRGLVARLRQWRVGVRW